MQGCSISDPYPLVAYSVHLESASPSSLRAPVISTSFTSVPGGEQGWATVTVQRDGIYIIDLASSQPIASHTLGPSTFFASPAITIIYSKDGNQFWRTYVAVHLDSAGSSSTSHEVWYWEDDIARPFASSLPKRQTLSLTHSVKTLLPLSESVGVLAISYESHATSLLLHDTAISTTSNLLEWSREDTLVHAWIFDLDECNFVKKSENGPTYHAILARLQQRGQKDKVLLNIDTLRSDGRFLLTHCLELLQPIPEIIVKATLSPNGDLSTLLASGVLHHYRVGLSYTDPQASSPTQTTLRPSPISATLDPQASMLPLTDSHVLLATITQSPSANSSPTPQTTLNLDLQIRDLKYDGLSLATFSAKLPSTSTMDPSTEVDVSATAPQLPILDLVGATKTHAILTIRPPALSDRSVSPIKKKGEARIKTSQDVTSGTAPSRNGRSHVLVVPFVVPPQSTLAMAVIARKALSLSKSHSDGHLGHPESTNDSDVLISTIQDAISRGHPEDSVKAFWRHVDAKDSSVHQSEKAGSASIQSRRMRVPLPHSFVARVVDCIGSSPSTAWGSLRTLIDFFLKRRVLTNAMLRLDGGLIRMLGERGDWSLVRICMQELPDIPEAEIVRLLRTVVDASIRKPKNNLMNIDSLSSDSAPAAPFSISPILSLPVFLALMLSYPTSPTHLRPGIREYFGSNVDVVMPILRQVKKWLEWWNEEGDDVLSALVTSSTLNEKGVDGLPKLAFPGKPKRRTDATGRTLLVVDDYEDGGILGGEDLLTEVGGEPGNGEEGRTFKKGSIFSVARIEEHGRPPLKDILTFLEVILDTSFLTLIQNRPAQEFLLSLSSIIRTELEIFFEMSKLRGPLEPFARADRERVRASRSKAERGRGADTGDPVTAAADVSEALPLRRRYARDNAALVGVYQVEELEL